jgi:hypothetical protein
MALHVSLPYGVSVLTSWPLRSVPLGQKRNEYVLRSAGRFFAA